MAHHLKSGTEKQRLSRLIIGEISLSLYATHFVKHVTNEQAQYNAPEACSRK